MDKINPLQFVTDTDPVPEAVIDASGWFAWEYTTYDYHNRDGTNQLPWFQAQGWVVYSTLHSFGVDPDDPNYQTFYSLRRRKLQADKALNDLIADFTAAYNEGRSINDQRYDEIVAIFNATLDKTENELNALDDSNTDSYETLLANLLPDFEDYDDDAAGLLDDWGDSQRARINLQFDNESNAARQNLISRGMYNSTVWTTSSAGIERRRAEALNDLEDKILARRAALLEGTYDRKIKMRVAVLDAHARLVGLKRDNKFRPLELRNSVLTAMLNFMERRQDEYPGLEKLGELAGKLGLASVGSSFTP